MPRIQDIGAFNGVRESGLAKLLPAVARITVGMGTCGRGNGAEELFHALNGAIQGKASRLPAGDAASRAGPRCRPHPGKRLNTCDAA